MSTLVDERVVEMRFDNRDFEKNTKQSMSTIQKLKASLNFSGVANSVNDGIKSIDVNPLIASLEKAEGAFNTWEIAAISIISNITNRLVDLGIDLVKSLSIDQVMSGWEQFGELTRNTGTMIAQLTGKGYDEEKAIEMTNEAMDKFMWYADSTSFSIEQMTSAASKFINNGKSLKEAFTIVAGIGNLGASAGKSAQDLIPIFESVAKVGDRIMTQQYNSFQLAGIMTEEFRNKLLEAAAAEGTLTKFTDTFDGSVEYYLDDMAITVENFRDSISKGWLKSDIFFKTLDQYGESVEKIYNLNKELQEAEDLLDTGREISSYTAIDTFNERAKEAVENAQKMVEEAKALGDETAIANAQLELSAALADRFSGKWTKAATEARTFKEAVTAVKDAVKSEWSRIFTLIIGDYKKATDVWSTFSDKLYKTFAAPLASIRKLIEKDNFAAIQQSLFGNTEEVASEPIGALWNLMNAIIKLKETISAAYHEVFKPKKKLSELAESFRVFTEKLILSDDAAAKFKSVFKGIFSVFKLGIKILQGVKVALTPIFKALTGDSGKLLSFLAKIGDKFTKWVDTTNIFVSAGQKVSEVFSTIINTLKELKIIENLGKSFKEFFSQIHASKEIKEFIVSLKQTCNSLFTFLLTAIKKILVFGGKYLIPELANIAKYLIVVIGIVAKGVVQAIQSLIKGIQKLFNFLKSNETIQNRWMQFIDFLKSIPDRLKSLAPFFSKLGKSIGDFIIAVISAVKHIGAGIAKMFKLNSFGDLFAKIGDKIAYGFKRIVDGIRSVSSTDMSNSVNGIKKRLSPLEPLIRGLLDLFKGLWTVFKALIPVIGAILTAVGNLLTQIGNSLTKTFNQKVAGNKGFNLWYLINGGFGLIIAKGLYDFVYLFNGITSAIANTIDALGSTMRAKAVIMWATAIKTIAMAMLMMVGAIMLITLIDESKLQTAVSTLAKIMGMLAAVVTLMGLFLKTTYSQTTIFPKYSKARGFRGGAHSSSGSGFLGVSGMILAFGLSVLALVAALKVIETIDPDKIGKDLLVLGAIMGMLAVSVGLMNAMSNIGSKVKGGVKGIKGLLSFALAVWILVIPLQKLGEMPLEKLRQGLIAIGALLLAYAGAVRLANGLKAKSMSKIAVFAAGMAALVAPVQLLGELPLDKLAKGVGAIVVLVASFSALTKLSSDFKPSSAIGLVATFTAFGFVIKVLTELINGPIGSISDKAIRNYSIIAGSLLIFVGMIGLLIKRTEKKGRKIEKNKITLMKSLASIAVVLLSLSATIVLLMHMAKIMNQVNWSAFGVSLALFGLVIGLTVGALEYAKRIKADSGLLKNVAIMAIVLGALTSTLYVLGILMNAVKDIGGNPTQVLGLILASLATVLIGVVALTAISGKVSTDAYKGMAAVSTVFLALAGLMIGFAALVSVVKNTNGDVILKTLRVLGIIVLSTIALIAVAVKFRSQIEKVSESLIELAMTFAIFGVGVMAFAAGIAILKNNLAGMLVFAGAVLVLALAMKVLGSQNRTMATVAAMFAAIGVSVLGVGAAMYLISMALEKMLPMLDELAQKSDSLKIILSNLMQGIIEGVANALPVLTEKIMTSLDILVSWVIDKVKSLVNWFMGVDLKDLFKITEKIWMLLSGLLEQGLTYLSAQSGKIAGTLIDMFIQLIYALVERLPQLTQALMDLAIGLIDSFGETLKNNAERLRESIVNFAKNVWQAFLNFFGIHSPSKETEKAGVNIIEGLINGFGKTYGKAVQVILKIGNQLLKAILKLPSQFIKAGANTFKAFLNGLSSVANSIISFCTNIWNKIKSIFTGKKQTSDFKDAGKQTMLSYKEGIDSADLDVNQAAKDVIQQTIEELSKTDIFRIIGEEIVEQICTGIELNSYAIADVLDSAIYEAIDATADAYEEMSDRIQTNDSIDNLVNSLTAPLYNGLAAINKNLNALFLNPINDMLESSAKLIDASSPKLSKEIDLLCAGISYVRFQKDQGLSWLTDHIKMAIGDSESIITGSIPDIEQALNTLLAVINNELTDDTLTIRPVMDISDIEEKTAMIAGMLYSVSGINIATISAERASSEINASKQAREDSVSSTNTQLEATGSQGEVYNVTFNITGNDPKAIADEVSKRFQQYTSRRNIAYGK